MIDEFLGSYQSLNDESLDMILTERWKADSSSTKATNLITSILTTTETSGTDDPTTTVTIKAGTQTTPVPNSSTSTKG